MNKKALVQFFGFGVITAILFLGGTLGVFFTVKHVNRIRELEKSEVIEEAVITRVERRSRTSNNTIYFYTENDRKTHRMHLLILLSTEVEEGDKLEVKFNSDRTVFLITNYQSATYIGYNVQIGLFIVCFLLSILFLRGTIDTYKNIRGK